MKRLLLTLAGVLFFTGPLPAEQSAQVMVRGIEFPPGEAEKILRTVKIDERYDAMAKAVDEGKAVDVETAMMRCPLTEKSTLQSVQEVIYPTEPDVDDGLSSRQRPTPLEFPPPGDIWGSWLMSRFETDRIGSTFQIEVTPAKQWGSLSIEGSYESAVQEPDRVFLKHELYKGNAQTIARPVFRRRLIQLQLSTVDDGAWMMLAMFDSSRKDAPKGSKVVMWVNVETLEPKKP